MARLKKFSKIFAIGMSDMFAWRFGFFTITMGTALGWGVMLLFWQAVYREGNRIGNFSLHQLVLYYTFITLFQIIFDTTFIWDMATSVHEGRLTEFLVKPVSYLSFQAMRELGARTTTLFATAIPLAAVVAYFWNDMPRAPQLWLSVGIFLASGFTLVMLFGFIVAMATAFFESPYHGPSIFLTISLLLSGRIVPLSLMPHWLLIIARWSPFPFLGNDAVEIILGTRGAITAREIALLCGWFVILFFGSKIIWRTAAIKYEAGGI